MTNVTYKDKLAKLMVMLAPGYKFRDDDSSIESLFRECCVLCGDEINTWNWCDCGSFKLSDTPRALYRILWLLKPKSINFSDMYKSELLSFATPDYRFCCSFELFKYEAGVYCYAPEDSVCGSGRALVAGWPGADNGWKCSDETGCLFFDVVRAVLEHTHEVYGGNNFEV